MIKNPKARKLLLFAIILLAVCAFYIGKEKIGLPIAFEETNETAQSGRMAQGNYVLICEDNGLRNFPFVVGGRLNLVSVPDGERYLIKDQKSWLQGIAEPTIQDDMVYWFDSWDGSSQGSFHATNIRNKLRVYDTPKFLYTDVYAFSGDEMYYSTGSIDTEDNKEPKPGVICRNIQTGEEKRLLAGYINFLTVKDSVLYCYDRKEKVLIQKSLETNICKAFDLKLSGGDGVTTIEPYGGSQLLVQTEKTGILKYNMENGDVEQIIVNGDFTKGNVNSAVSGGGETMKRKGNSLFYYDAYANVYEFDLKNHACKKIIDWKYVDFVKPYIKAIGDAAMVLSWCKDYIAVQTGYYDSESDTWMAGLLFFDYKGNLVYEERNDKLPL